MNENFRIKSKRGLPTSCRDVTVGRSWVNYIEVFCANSVGRLTSRSRAIEISECACIYECSMSSQTRKKS